MARRTQVTFRGDPDQTLKAATALAVLALALDPEVRRVRITHTVEEWVPTWCPPREPGIKGALKRAFFLD